MKTAEEWITEIDFEIERLKLAGRHTYFQIALSMTHETSSKIFDYFNKLKYNIEVEKCHSCANKYSIIITW
jgi:hypothetical protein